MRERAIVIIGLVLLGILALAWYVASHWAQFAILNPAGPVALAERNLMLITVLACATVVVPVFGMLFVFSLRYSAENPHAAERHTPELDHTDRVAEFVWWLVPSVVIVFLGFLAWQSSNALDPYKPLAGGPAMTIQVVALDWKWLFIYPAQDIASVNLAEFPANTPVHFELTADAPMNSFWIPQLGGQIMVMPGMTTQLNLEASRLGDFNGFSGNISGAGFAGMAFTARAVSQSDFNAWVASVQSAQHPLDANAYAALAAPSEYNPVEYFSPIDPALYTDVTMQYMSTSTEKEGGMTMP